MTRCNSGSGIGFCGGFGSTAAYCAAAIGAVPHEKLGPAVIDREAAIDAAGSGSQNAAVHEACFRPQPGIPLVL